MNTGGVVKRWRLRASHEAEEGLCGGAWKAACGRRTRGRACRIERDRRLAARCWIQGRYLDDQVLGLDVV
jgi:hypothetical protein